MRIRLLFAFIAAVLLLGVAAASCGKREAGPASAPPSAAPAASAPSGAPASIVWMGYTEGMKTARETGKPVMVDFFTTWCKYCKMLDEKTYTDPGVIAALSRDYVAIKVNAEGSEQVEEGGKTMTERELAQQYQVTGFPTLWFMDKSGKPVGQAPGYQTPEELMPRLAYIADGSFAKGVDFNEYVKSYKK